MIYKTLHRKIKIEQHEPTLNPKVNSVGDILTPLITPVVLLLTTGTSYVMKILKKNHL